MSRAIACVLVLGGFLAGGSDVRAAWSFGLESQVGARQLDSRLADYRWEPGPVPVLGLDAVAERGRWSLRLGAVRSGTEQFTGLPGVATVPTVALTEFGLRAGVTLFRAGAMRCDAAVGVGRTHLAWDPERLDVTVEGTRVVVDFDPITRWSRSLDLALVWDAHTDLAMGLRGRVGRFALETAHRRGDAIVEQVEDFETYDLTFFVRLVAWRPSSNPESLR